MLRRVLTRSYSSYHPSITSTLNVQKYPFLNELDINARYPEWLYKELSGTIDSFNPSNGEIIGTVGNNSDWVVNGTHHHDELFRSNCNAVVNEETIRDLPAPARGEFLRVLSDKLREKKEPLGKLISVEVGKSLQEGLGEVQEFIDICDYAVGLSRTLEGKILPSERLDHLLVERYHPLGTVGVISAFNFPCAVFGWNFAIATVTGNATVWKGSETTPMTTIATGNIVWEAMEEYGGYKFTNHGCPFFHYLVGGGDVGAKMVASKDIDLMSFTGSTNVGRQVGVEVQKRMGKSLLELGGNNAAFILKDANLEIAIPR